MSWLAMMRLQFDTFTVDLYYADHLPEKVTTNPQNATVRENPTELTKMITDTFGGYSTQTGEQWVLERVLIYDSGVL